jgi:hypothetical protein
VHFVANPVSLQFTKSFHPQKVMENAVFPCLAWFYKANFCLYMVENNVMGKNLCNAKTIKYMEKNVGKSLKYCRSWQHQLTKHYVNLYCPAINAF